MKDYTTMHIAAKTATPTHCDKAPHCPDSGSDTKLEADLVSGICFLALLLAFVGVLMAAL